MNIQTLSSALKLLCVFVFCMLCAGSFGEEIMPFAKAVKQLDTLDDPLLRKSAVIFVETFPGIQKPQGDPTQQIIDNVIESCVISRDLMAYLEMAQYRRPASFKQYARLLLSLFGKAATNTLWIEDLPDNEDNKYLHLSRQSLLVRIAKLEKGYIVPAQSCTAAYEETPETTKDKNEDK